MVAKTTFAECVPSLLLYPLVQDLTDLEYSHDDALSSVLFFGTFSLDELSRASCTPLQVEPLHFIRKKKFFFKPQKEALPRRVVNTTIAAKRTFDSVYVLTRQVCFVICLRCIY
jgi:hypothetical protein